MAIKHTKVVVGVDDPTKEVSASEWNDSHAIEAGTIVNADVSGSAAIAESKLALSYPTHSNANDPSAGEKALLPDLAYIKSAVIAKLCSGLISGGAISVNVNGTTIDIASGTGDINNHAGGSGYSQVSWTAKTAVAMLGNGSNYIAINTDGSVDVSLTRQTMGDHVYLGHVYVAGGNVIEVFNVPEWTAHFQGRVNEWMSNAVGSLISEGLLVTEQANPNELKLSISAGEFYARLGQFVFGAPVTTFTKMYNSTDGWSGDGNNVNYVNVTQWNDVTQNQAGALVTMNDGYWKKDLLLLTPSGNAYYIFGQAEYTTEDAAIAGVIPTIPDQIKLDSVYLCIIVSQKGDTSIASRIRDISPRLDRLFGYGTSSGGSVTDHGSLVGLADDDHAQYLNIARHSTAAHSLMVIGGNTTGTTGTIQSLATFAGGSNITLSQNGNAVTIIGADPGAGAGIAARGSGTYVATSGTVQFANSNGITFGLSANNVMTASHNGLTSQSVQTQNMVSVQGSSGNISFVNSNGITFGGNASTLTASHNALTSQSIQTQNLHNVTLSGNTAGVMAQVSSGTLTLAGGNNITLSQNGNAVTISGANVGGAQTGISGIGVSNTTYTSGSVIWSAQANVTLNSSVNGVSQYVQISGNAAQTAQTQNLHNVTLSGNTAGAMAQVSSGTLTLAGGNNITLSQNGNAVTISAGAGGGGVAIAVNALTTYTSGTVVISAGNNITLGTNGQTITISAPNPGGGAAPTINWFHNVINMSGVSAVSSQALALNNSISVFPITPGNIFGGNMTINTLMMVLSMSNSTVTASSAKTLNVDIGIYTKNGSSLSLLNSVRSAMTHAAAANNSQSYFGARYFTIHSSLWSGQPVLTQGGDYYIAIKFSSAGQAVQTCAGYVQYCMATLNRSGTVGSVSNTNTSCGWDPFHGIVSFTTATMPVSIGMAAINKQSANANAVMALTFNNLMASY